MRLLEDDLGVGFAMTAMMGVMCTKTKSRDQVRIKSRWTATLPVVRSPTPTPDDDSLECL